MKGGFLTYKCRRCSAIIENVHAPDIDIALAFLCAGRDLPEKWAGTEMAAQTTTHHCSDALIGIADLIGGRRDRE